MRQDRVGGAFQDIKRNRIGCEFVSVNQAATGLVERVARQMIVNVELTRRLDRLAKRANQTVHFGLGDLVSRDGVSPRQTGHILAETVARNKAMKTPAGRIKVVAVVIPAAEIRARSRHSPTLTERLEQPIFIQIQEDSVIVVELLTE